MVIWVDFLFSGKWAHTIVSADVDHLEAELIGELCEMLGDSDVQLERGNDQIKVYWGCYRRYICAPTFSVPVGSRSATSGRLSAAQWMNTSGLRSWIRFETDCSSRRSICMTFKTVGVDWSREPNSMVLLQTYLLQAWAWSSEGKWDDWDDEEDDQCGCSLPQNKKTPTYLDGPFRSHRFWTDPRWPCRVNLFTSASQMCSSETTQWKQLMIGGATDLMHRW